MSSAHQIRIFKFTQEGMHLVFIFTELGSRLKVDVSIPKYYLKVQFLSYAEDQSINGYVRKNMAVYSENIIRSISILCE
jgi:hypothetical protein